MQFDEWARNEGCRLRDINENFLHATTMTTTATIQYTIHAMDNLLREVKRKNCLNFRKNIYIITQKKYVSILYGLVEKIKKDMMRVKCVCWMDVMGVV